MICGVCEQYVLTTTRVHALKNYTEKKAILCFFPSPSFLCEMAAAGEDQVRDLSFNIYKMKQKGKKKAVKRPRLLTTL